MKKLPIGIQTIQEIITDRYIYVDKTQFALGLIQNGKHTSSLVLVALASPSL